MANESSLTRTEVSMVAYAPQPLSLSASQPLALQGRREEHGLEPMRQHKKTVAKENLLHSLLLLSHGDGNRCPDHAAELTSLLLWNALGKNAWEIGAWVDRCMTGT